MSGGQYVCRRCGREQATDLRTCECGSASFRPLTERLTRRCTECGDLATESVDACEACGFRSFEPLGGGTENPGGAHRTEPDGGGDTGYLEWHCTDCGKSHTKHAPPCSRCGNARLERVRVDPETVAVADFVSGSEWWRLDRTTVALVVVAIAIVGAVGSGLLGLGPLAGAGDPWADDVNRTALETGLGDRLNTERTTRGMDPLRADSALEDHVESTVGAWATADADPHDLDGPAGCTPTPVAMTVDGTARVEGGPPDAARLSRGLTDTLLDGGEDERALLDPEHGSLAVGTALDEGTIYVLVALC